MRLVVDWAHSDSLPVRLYHRGRTGRVLIMNGFGDNVRLLHLVKPTDHVISFTVGAYDAETYRMTLRAIRLFGLAPQRVSVLCNEPDQLYAAQRCGLRAFLVNKNAFIDESVFRPRLMQKRFSAVSNARLAKAKRVHLAKLVENLAIIRGHELEETDYDDPAEIPHQYMNGGHLSPREVVNVLSACRVGLALSAAEGACQASSEYLLCGLPVVSTPNRGGRAIWYDAANSLICEPTPEAVRDAVRHQLARLHRGELDPQSIRLRHVALAQEHRERFIQVLAHAFDDVAAVADLRLEFERALAARAIVPQYREYSAIASEMSQ